MTNQTLYRFWDSDDRLLYVGISVRPWQRWKEHRGEKPWWDEVSKVTMEQFGSRAEVSDAERKAIRLEEPVYNIQHSAKPHASKAQPQTEAEEEAWNGVHAPRLSFGGGGGEFYCDCRPPDWDSQPVPPPATVTLANHPLYNAEAAANYQEAFRVWVIRQAWFDAEDFAYHVIEETLGQHFVMCTGGRWATEPVGSR